MKLEQAELKEFNEEISVLQDSFKNIYKQIKYLDPRSNAGQIAGLIQAMESFLVDLEEFSLLEEESSVFNNCRYYIDASKKYLGV